VVVAHVLILILLFWMVLGDALSNSRSWARKRDTLFPFTHTKVAKKLNRGRDEA
jgi:hypothetical protein